MINIVGPAGFTGKFVCLFFSSFLVGTVPPPFGWRTDNQHDIGANENSRVKQEAN